MRIQNASASCAIALLTTSLVACAGTSDFSTEEAKADHEGNVPANVLAEIQAEPPAPPSTEPNDRDARADLAPRQFSYGMRPGWYWTNRTGPYLYLYPRGGYRWYPSCVGMGCSYYTGYYNPWPNYGLGAYRFYDPYFGYRYFNYNVGGLYGYGHNFRYWWP